MDTRNDMLWLALSGLLRDVLLGHWRQALVWARAVVTHLRDLEGVSDAK